MFRKLISNLPFSPSLINQIGFYSKRLKKEEFTRRIGLVFTVLAIIVQSFASFAPAKPTLAASNNDIIYGGGNLEAIKQAYASGCDSKGRCDIKAIFHAFGVDGWGLANATYETIYSSEANNYWSIGRTPRGYGGEVAKPVPGGPTVYSRTLHGWSANRNWNAIRVETGQGTRWILTECGNIVTKESKPVVPPDMKMEKTVSKPTVKKGEKFYFTLKATNIGGSTAKSVLLYDNSEAHLELQPDGLGSDPLKHVMRWETHKRFDIGPGQSYTYRIYAIARKDNVTLKNTACADFFDVNVYNNCATATVRVQEDPEPEKCPYDPSLSKTDPKCKPPVEKCPYNSSLPKDSPLCKPPQEKCPYNPSLTIGSPLCKPPEPCPYNSSLQKNDPNCKPPVEKCPYDPSLSKTDPKCKPPVEKCPYNSSLPKDSPLCKPPVEKCPIPGKESLSINDPNCKEDTCPHNPNLQKDDPNCKPCDETKLDENNKDISCLELHKKARNITQKIADANNTRANASDLIEYTLSVTNHSKEVRKGFVIEENMDDVLEYADIIDASGATYTSSPVRMLSWAPVDIQPGATVTRTVLVKIKSTIPTTPASISDPHSNDLKLVNFYGDSIQIRLPQHPIKTIEQTVRYLPRTGIGANLIVSTLLITISTYFYTRSKLMVKELGLVRQQFNYGAGV